VILYRIASLGIAATPIAPPRQIGVFPIRGEGLTTFFFTIHVYLRGIG